MKKVFISSTSKDLADYRQAATETCLKLGLFPIDMKHFEAMSFGASEGSKRKLDGADVYIGIFAHRYGYVEDGYDKSVTELEFDYAGERGLDRLCFLIDPTHPWPDDGDHRDGDARLATLKGRVNKLIRSEFTTVDDFSAKLIQALAAWKEVHEPRGRFVFRLGVVVALLITLIVLGGAAGYAAWQFAQPPVMTGDFNIAVAQFADVAAGSTTPAGVLVSQALFDFLESEYSNSNFGITVQLAHDKIGVIAEASAAQQLAQTIQADLVIYGTVTTSADQLVVSPKFYVADLFRNDVGELAGQHELAFPVEMAISDVTDFTAQGSASLRQKASILLDFTEGLGYFAGEAYAFSLRAFERAIAGASAYADFKGQEVLYLFGANAAVKLKDVDTAQRYVDQALVLNPVYARAYIAQGNIDYVRQDYETALAHFEQAVSMEDQSFGARIAEKAGVSIGNIYTVLYQTAGDAQKPGYAQQALAHYQPVIEAYVASSSGDLRELAAGAYYGSGMIAQFEGDLSGAADAFQQTLILTRNSELRTRANNRLNMVSQLLGTASVGGSS
jgi:tetratricopeptide (TPR) repeat protein